MHITYEKHKELSLIYVYLRDFDGSIVNTIAYASSFLLIDKNNNWIGFEVVNNSIDEGEIELPNLHNHYISKKSEMIEMNKKRILVMFDSSSIIDRKIEVDCNIDYNKNGLQGFEFILSDFIGNYEIARQFFD